jgi:hypothetical protein
VSGDARTPPGGGIDRLSTVDDIRDAFGRKGLELSLEPRGGEWIAIVRAHGVPSAESCSPDRTDAARAAWADFVARNAGTGES